MFKERSDSETYASSQNDLVSGVDKQMDLRKIVSDGVDLIFQ
jgi:hypothetical protein